MSKRARSDSAPELVEFNVGGRIYLAARTTLCSYPSSMLARVFSDGDAIGHTTDSEGRPFLCRDPDMFGHVLAYLRSNRLVCPMVKGELVVDTPHDELSAHGSFTDPTQNLAVVQRDYVDPEFLIKLDAEADYFGLETLRTAIGSAARRMPTKFWSARCCSADILRRWGWKAKDMYSSCTADYPPEDLWDLCVTDRVGPVGSGKIKFHDTTYVIARGGPVSARGKVCIVIHDATSPDVPHLKLTDNYFVKDEAVHAVDEFLLGVRYLRFDGESE